MSSNDAPLNSWKFSNRNAEHMSISSITLADLMYGVEKSSFPEKNLKVVEDFISHLEVLSYDEGAAMQYGNIRSDLEKKKTTIEVNNLHIAAHARSRALILVTNNTKDFEQVDGLRLVDWTEQDR